MEILSVHSCGRFISSISLQNLHCLFAIFKGCFCRPLSNKIVLRLSDFNCKSYSFSGLRKRVFLSFPICLYNIVLDYDVSLHNLFVLVVTIPTSPRLSKTEFICKSYGPLDLLLDLPRRWSGVSGPDRSLRPKDPESPALRFSLLCAKVWCAPVASPEGHRRYPGVSGP